ncbi:3'-5' exoribonuclease 1-like [Gigantopelta aegis]|uniref:3'-5' exoribonuclease 1-like n=1 Tax=Gigantopelta aegis TaxID=1735272 RepID=UPI001B88BFBE|nr:3'-5' exoribonuclease 1-like [Gigantopelta aegis]
MLWTSNDDPESTPTEPNELQDENNSSVPDSKPRPKARRDDSDFSDPVFKKLSRLNGEVNQMTKEELKVKLTTLRLDSRGVKDILKRRLKNYYKKQSLMKAHIKSPGNTKFDYLLVIDYEATCMENNTNYKHEIIEFPGVLIDVQEMKIVDEFHCYCKPQLNRRLTAFCTQLTGITQEKVDAAAEFPEVLSRFQEWMSSHHLHEYYKVAIVTDGPWDMSRFMFTQCQLSGICYPRWAKKWINIRKLYSNYYQCRRCRIEEMLSRLGMKFEGNLHSGIDDARNIARIAMHMLKDGCAFKLNEFINIYQHGAAKQVQAEVEIINNKIFDDDDEEEHSPETDGESVDGGVTRKPLNTGVTPSRSTSSSQESQVSQSVSVLSSRDSEPSQSVTALSLSESGESVDDLIHYYKLQSL